MKLDNSFLWGGIAVLAVVIILLCTCNRCNHSGISTSRTDTVKVVRDTQFIKFKKDTVYIIKPVRVADTVYVPKYKTRVDSFVVFEKPLPKKDSTDNELTFADESAIDTPAVVKDWLSARFYSDTQRTKYGNIYINDVISRNTILHRHLGFDFSVPLITNNITTNKRNVTGYIGLSVFGSKINPLFSYGLDLGLQTLNRRIYSAQVSYTINKELLFGGRIQVPITFKRN